MQDIPEYRIMQIGRDFPSLSVQDTPEGLCDTRNLSKYGQKASPLPNAHGQAHKTGDGHERENYTEKNYHTEKLFFLVLRMQIHHGSIAQTSPRFEFLRKFSQLFD